ncbi:hypothetical protein J7E91_03030 [Streptomyces sp. ISL-99]|uniref:hypothetical protein n=1 Tax=Streptomyces sp. ISL-99 TaxID=2819193 RepID=UPI001BEBD8A9|nr:hypothetical protein [Streptomyces sp. ISL-99]MBT2524432.1 hypothetical protein [Streptomyces sp. ISL-99]
MSPHLNLNLTKKLAVALAATALTAGLAGVTAPATAAPAGPAAECGVRSDGKLYCGNRAGAKGYEHRSYASAVRGRMNTTFSWFQCWGRGDSHPGGNNIWYWTKLDNGQWGNMPAVDVHTSVDPAPGLREC